MSRRLLAACPSCGRGEHAGHVHEFTIASVWDALCDCLGDCAARAAAFARDEAPSNAAAPVVEPPAPHNEETT